MSDIITDPTHPAGDDEMRIDANVVEKSRPEDREVALLAAEVRRLQAVIDSRDPALTADERGAIGWVLSIPLLDRDVTRVLPLRGLLERLG